MDINCHNLFFVVESNFVTTEKSDQRWAHTELPFFLRGPYRTTGLGTFAQPPSMMIMGLYARIRSRPWMWAEKGYHSASAAYDGTGNVYIPLSAAALPVTCSSLQYLFAVFHRVLHKKRVTLLIVVSCHISLVRFSRSGVPLGSKSQQQQQENEPNSLGSLDSGTSFSGA